MTRRSLVQLQPLQFLAFVAQLEEYVISAHKVVGSTPAGGIYGNIAQLVERMNHNHWVGSSNLSVAIKKG